MPPLLPPFHTFFFSCSLILSFSHAHFTPYLRPLPPPWLADFVLQWNTKRTHPRSDTNAAMESRSRSRSATSRLGPMPPGLDLSSLSAGVRCSGRDIVATKEAAAAAAAVVVVAQTSCTSLLFTLQVWEGKALPVALSLFTSSCSLTCCHDNAQAHQHRMNSGGWLWEGDGREGTVQTVFSPVLSNLLTHHCSSFLCDLGTFGWVFGGGERIC